MLIYITSENHKLVPWLNEISPIQYFRLTQAGLFLSVTLSHTCFWLLLVFSLKWFLVLHHYTTFLCPLEEFVELFMSRLFYEQNPRMIISGVTTYLILLQNKGNILFTYKYVIVFFVNASISGCTLTRWFVMCLRIPQNSFD